MVLTILIFGSFFKDFQADLCASGYSEPHRYVGAIAYEEDLAGLRDLYGKLTIVEPNEKPLETARSYKSSKDFVVAVIKDSRDDDVFDEIHQTTFERVIKNFEFERVKYLAITNPSEIKTALYYFDLIDANEVHHIDGIYYFTKGDQDRHMAPVTITAFGDVMLGRHVRILMDQNGLNYPFEKAGDLKGTDFVHANFEGPIKEYAIPTSKSISFRFKPDVIWPLKESGINIVSIANNHALDQGWGGRDDTKRFLNEAGIRFFGHPKNEKENNVNITEVNDQKVAFIGYDDTIFKVDFEKTAQQIRDLEEQVDYTIISIHWGAEYKHKPLQRKVNMAHMFVDNGADLVIGHHPHVVQTMEIYNDVPIFYSLGNFVFDQYWSHDTQEGMGIGVELEPFQKTIYLYPYKLPNSQPEFMADSEKDAFLEKFITWGVYDEDLQIQIRQGKLDIWHY
ncbi:CapA family protein [Patescibacteria group bacterium]